MTFDGWLGSRRKVRGAVCTERADSGQDVAPHRVQLAKDAEDCM